MKKKKISKKPPTDPIKAARRVLDITIENSDKGSNMEYGPLASKVNKNWADSHNFISKNIDIILDDKHSYTFHCKEDLFDEIEELKGTTKIKISGIGMIGRLIESTKASIKKSGIISIPKTDDPS